MVTTASAVARGQARGNTSDRAHRPVDGVPRPRLESIDALRFAAAVGVMLYHFTAMWSTAWDRPPGEIFPELGQVVVYAVLAPELFFVVSGFVILWTAWGRDVPAFVGSRVGRLYPPYWAAVVLTSVLLIVVWPSGKDLTWGEAAVNLTLVQEGLGVRHVDGVYWTLWTELRFYLLIALLVAVGVTRRRVIAFAGLWPVVALAVEPVSPPLVDTLLMPRYAPYFAGGMILFLLHRDGHSRLLWALVGLHTALALHTTVEPTLTTIAGVTPFEASPVLMALGVVGTFGGVAVLSMTRLSRLHAPWLPGLGALTYALYLTHLYWGLWAIHLVHEHVPPVVALAAAVLVSVAVALAVHHLVEKPLSPRLRRAVDRGLRRLTDRRRAVGTQPGMPPTSPGSTVPSMIDEKRVALRSASRSTVDPTPPGR